jgi:Predicted nucleic acid-binding protein, contains PIN domain
VILADSSVWISYFNGNPTPAADLLDRLLDEADQTIVMADLVLFEILRGFRHDQEFEQARRWLGRLPCVEIGGVRLALRAAAHYRSLRKRGLTIRSPSDTLIATFCIEPRLSIRRRFAPTRALAAGLRPFLPLVRRPWNNHELLASNETVSQPTSPSSRVLMDNLG